VVAKAPSQPLHLPPPLALLPFRAMLLVHLVARLRPSQPQPPSNLITFVIEPTYQGKHRNRCFFFFMNLFLQKLN
jgi:hypothetical protein